MKRAKAGSIDPSGDGADVLAIGWATRADYGDLADVMFDAVRHGPSPYSEAQRAQWVPHRRAGTEWEARLDRQSIVLARNAKGVVGFMSVDATGYIDFAYIRPEAQGTGLFRKLFAQIEQRSGFGQDKRLWVHASLMAQPAFSAMGFQIVERQVVEIGGESLERFEMERR